MANQEHLDILKQGVDIWNKWREENVGVQPDLLEADLREEDLSGANLRQANLHEACLSEAYLCKANLSKADLSWADLRNVNLCEADLNRANLREAELSGAYLCAANLYAANLSNANLSHSDLTRTSLREVHFCESDLSRADLRQANLSGADLQRADLSGADLSHVMLDSVKLNEAKLYEAIIGGTIFTNIDLGKTKGLVEIYHQGPSHIVLNTIQLPSDGSALHFLRGAGVPDEWIDFWRSTAMSAIQYHSLFISYSNKDETLARRLHADLQARGVRCWFAPEDMKIGDKIRIRIDEAIHVHEKLLLLLSEHAIASAWVEDEVEAALEKEQRQQREVLFPVRLDESVMKTTQPWATKLRRTRHVGDFTRWKEHDEYQKGLTRLLRDLKQDAVSKDIRKE